jgi:predicted transcriptional regulator with HTH domain
MLKRLAVISLLCISILLLLVGCGNYKDSLNSIKIKQLDPATVEITIGSISSRYDDDYSIMQGMILQINNKVGIESYRIERNSSSITGTIFLSNPAIIGYHIKDHPPMAEIIVEKVWR